MYGDQISQLAQSQQQGLPQLQTDESGRKYMPTMQALKFLQDSQQQKFDNGIKESAVTGYYAPSGLRDTLDQIQKNKDTNLNTQDSTAQTNAQQQNHALYSVLKSRYGIDGESMFNTDNNNQNDLNIASAYKGMPTLNRENIDYDNQMKKAQLLGMLDGQPTLAKQTLDANQAYRAASLSARGSGGGGRSSSSGSAKTSKPTAQSTYANWLSEFSKDASRQGEMGGVDTNGNGINDGSLQEREQWLLQNADQLAQSGEDVNKAIDALYTAYSNGQFKSKKEYVDFANNLKKQRDKYYEQQDDPMYQARVKAAKEKLAE
jgi:hypothetical protein